jgi:hypothetical protein
MIMSMHHHSGRSNVVRSSGTHSSCSRLCCQQIELSGPRGTACSCCCSVPLRCRSQVHMVLLRHHQCSRHHM